MASSDIHAGHVATLNSGDINPELLPGALQLAQPVRIDNELSCEQARKNAYNDFEAYLLTKGYEPPENVSWGRYQSWRSLFPSFSSSAETPLISSDDNVQSIPEASAKKILASSLVVLDRALVRKANDLTKTAMGASFMLAILLVLSALAWGITPVRNASRGFQSLMLLPVEIMMFIVLQIVTDKLIVTKCRRNVAYCQRRLENDEILVKDKFRLKGIAWAIASLP